MADDVTFNQETGFTDASGMIDIYHYDSETRALTGKENVYRNVGISAPANGTYIAPPAYGEGVIPVFDEDRGAWNIVEDHMGTVVYDTTNAGITFPWNKPGKISDQYTTVAPKTQYDQWDAATKSWTTNTKAQQEALQKEAADLLSKTIIPMVQTVQSMGQELGPKYTAYREAVAMIAWGKDTTSTTLPESVVDPTS